MRGGGGTARAVRGHCRRSGEVGAEARGKAAADGPLAQSVSYTFLEPAAALLLLAFCRVLEMGFDDRVRRDSCCGLLSALRCELTRREGWASAAVD